MPKLHPALRLREFLDTRAASDVRRAYADTHTAAWSELRRRMEAILARPLTPSEREVLARHARVVHARSVRAAAMALLALLPRARKEGLAHLRDELERDVEHEAVIASGRPPEDAVALRRIALATWLSALWASVREASGAASSLRAGEVVDRMAGVSADTGRLDRIVMTEAAAEYNRARGHALTVLGRRDPTLYVRWTEHVDEATGTPLDSRVGEDSLLMHGQVVRPGGLFEMPDEPGCSTMAGWTWAAPPNRPHDRAVLTPYRLSEGLTAYQMEGGKRRWLIDPYGTRVHRGTS